MGVPPPKIVVPPRPLHCVPFARKASGIPIRGNAGTWWRSAHEKFRRGTAPDVGAVLVMRETRRNKYGHIAVVTEVLNSREIVVDHANWLNQRRIHIGTPVRDVSPKNDWSSVQVWYTPGNRYGAGVYPMYGFIYPEPSQLFMTVQNANVRTAPSAKSARITTLPMRTKVEVVERITGASWYRIAHRGQVLGYVFAPLIKPLI
jgi:surface antigen